MVEAAPQVILEALSKVGADREKIRAYVVDPTHNYDTVLGQIHFDANGDTTSPILSLYKVQGGKGVLVDEITVKT